MQLKPRKTSENRLKRPLIELNLVSHPKQLKTLLFLSKKSSETLIFLSSFSQSWLSILKNGSQSTIKTSTPREFTSRSEKSTRRSRCSATWGQFRSSWQCPSVTRTNRRKPSNASHGSCGCFFERITPRTSEPNADDDAQFFHLESSRKRNCFHLIYSKIQVPEEDVE